jgi:hypothetical protein
MDLLTRVVVYAVIIVAVLFAVYYAAGMIPAPAPTRQQAAVNITQYLDGIYGSGANVTITNITQSSKYPGSWQVLASVVENATSPCPSYQSYYYIYPKFGLVNVTENIYTTGIPNCTVRYYAPGNKVTSAPEAITLAHNISSVRQYIQSYGFSNVKVSAMPYNQTIISGRNFSNVWWISYVAPKANYTLYAVISQNNGSVIKTASLPKS